MKEFTATGTITLEGVVFYFYAESEIEARAMVTEGRFPTFTIDQAEPVNWHIAEQSIEENV